VWWNEAAMYIRNNNYRLFRVCGESKFYKRSALKIFGTSESNVEDTDVGNLKNSKSSKNKLPIRSIVEENLGKSLKKMGAATFENKYYPFINLLIHPSTITLAKKKFKNLFFVKQKKDNSEDLENSKGEGKATIESEKTKNRKKMMKAFFGDFEEDDNISSENSKDNDEKEEDDFLFESKKKEKLKDEKVKRFCFMLLILFVY
jgi:hypothetical protein